MRFFDNNFLDRFKQLSWRSWLLLLAVLAVLLSLGFWQLQRAEHKRMALAVQDRMAIDKFLMSASTPDDISSLKYRPVSVTGHYVEAQQFLIDNQHVNGKVGYLVLTPFQIEGSEKAVLVNRGWLPLNKDRSVLPALPANTATVTLSGRINSFPGVGFKLAGAEIPTQTWPAVVQIVEVPILAKVLGYPLYSFQIELDPAMPEGFLRAWQPAVAMPPEKHIAYAIQWFGLAITFTGLFFWFNFKKQVDE